MQTWLLYLHFVFSRDVKRWQNNININITSLQVLFVDKLPAGFRDLAQFRKLFSSIVNPPYCQVRRVLAVSSNDVNGEIFQHVSFTAIKINESWPVATPVLWSSHGKYLFHYITLPALCVCQDVTPALTSPHCNLHRSPRRTESCRTGAWWSSTRPSRPRPPWRHWARLNWTIFQSGSSIVFQTSTPSIFIWVLSTIRWKTGEPIIDL